MDTEEVTFSSAGVRLSGIVTCPDAAAACPGVVLIGGSGPSDRHNDGFFDVLRMHLAGAGVAVLAYDKRGAGKSTGAFAPATVDDLAEDAAAAVAALQAHPRVAAGAVGVLGHSEGGWVALRLCARLNMPRHLIVNSCPAVSFAESETFALTAAGAEPGAAAALLKQLTAAARAGCDYQQGQQIIAACQHEPWYPLLSAGGFTLNSATWAQLTAWSDYDPLDDLARLTTPTLAIFGETIRWCLSAPALSVTRKQPPAPAGTSRPMSSPEPATGCSCPGIPDAAKHMVPGSGNITATGATMTNVMKPSVSAGEVGGLWPSDADRAVLFERRERVNL